MNWYSDDALWSILEHKAVVSVDVCCAVRDLPSLSGQADSPGDSHQPCVSSCGSGTGERARPQLWSPLQEALWGLSVVTVICCGPWGLRAAIAVVTTAPPHMEKGFLEIKYF